MDLGDLKFSGIYHTILSATILDVWFEQIEETNLEPSGHDKRREPYNRDQQNNYLNEEKFLLLQSIVMAVQIRDCHALTQLEDHFIPYIASETQQRDLLRLLVKSMLQKSN